MPKPPGNRARTVAEHADRGDSRFPDPAHALQEPNGLLASGGKLDPEWLVDAYRHGIFPWYNPGEPILWWSPDPRYGFVPRDVRLSRSRRRQLAGKHWRLSADTCFAQVMRHCATVPRKGQQGTWIDQAMIDAYCRLHRLGIGHSIEVFDGERLIGGLYGLAIGRVFFAESMFSLESNASALALHALARRLEGWGWPWIDAQLENAHLALLGGRPMPRTDYLALLAAETGVQGLPGAWQTHFAGLRCPDCLNR